MQKKIGNLFELVRRENFGYTILVTCAGYYLVALAILVSIRLFYPYELEWIEGAYVNESVWVSSGNFPYGLPNLAYLPTSKTPLFFYAAGFLMKIFGVNFFAPRLVSVLSLIGCLVLIYWIVANGTRGSVPGFVAAGLYAATFRFSGAWMDLAKTDSMFLCLILAAFALGLRYRHWAMQILSGILFVLAFFTKQITLPVVLALAPISLVASRGRTWLQWTVTAISGTALFLALDHYSQGWFSFYTVQTSTHHTRIADLLYFWKLMLPKTLPLLVLVVIYGVLVHLGVKGSLVV